MNLSEGTRTWSTVNSEVAHTINKCSQVVKPREMPGTGTDGKGVPPRTIGYTEERKEEETRRSYRPVGTQRRIESSRFRSEDPQTDSSGFRPTTKMNLRTSKESVYLFGIIGKESQRFYSHV